MIKVRNRHASRVGGVDPGETAIVTPDVFARYPWALHALAPDYQPEEDEGEDSPERLAAREQIQALRESADQDYVRSFVSDGRSSVHTAAVRRLRQLTEA